MNKEIKGTVLVVDDDPGSLKLLFNRLRDVGFKVLVAEDGKSALKRVQLSQPDIILLDVKLPDIDGFEVCRRLQEQYPEIEIPVLFLTVYADIADKVKGLNLYGVDYITKPFQPEEVVARVEKHLVLQHQPEGTAVGELVTKSHKLPDAPAHIVFVFAKARFQAGAQQDAEPYRHTEIERHLLPDAVLVAHLPRVGLEPGRPGVADV